MKFYFVGICGVMMAPLAVSMQKNGHTVTGSDKGFYPPISTYLRKNNVPLLVGFKEEHISDDIDVAVIGAAILPSNPEYLKIKELGIKHFMGYGEFLAQYYIKEHSVVCVGTYGKTTISAFVSYMFDVAGFNPTFAIGGIPLNFPDGVRLTDSDWSIAEGDEYINSRTDFIPRFMFYNPTHLILNAVKYDHLDIYKTEDDYINAYKALVEKMPDGSMVIANLNGEHVRDVLKGQEPRLDITYVSLDKDGSNPFKAGPYRYENEYTYFSVILDGNTYEFKTKILGLHNIKNMIMGIVLGYRVGIPVDVLQKAAEGFTGVKRRLEIRQENPFFVIDDLAHSPVKAKSTIDSVNERFPEKKIIAVFEPHTLSARLKSSLPMFAGSFTNADKVFVAPVYHPNVVVEDERITSFDIARSIGENAAGFNTFDELKHTIEETIKPGDILLFLSSGNIGGLLDYFSTTVL